MTRQHRRARGAVIYSKPGAAYLHIMRTIDGRSRWGLVFIIGSQASVFIGTPPPADLRAEIAGATRAQVVPPI